MSSPTQPGSDRRSQHNLRAVPCDEGVQNAVGKLIGHPVQVLGCAESQSRTDAERLPDKLTAGWYTDDEGHEHFYLAEMWPPEYHAGIVTVDFVLS